MDVNPFTPALIPRRTNALHAPSRNLLTIHSYNYICNAGIIIDKAPSTPGRKQHQDRYRGTSTAEQEYRCKKPSPSLSAWEGQQNNHRKRRVDKNYGAEMAGTTPTVLPNVESRRQTKGAPPELHLPLLNLHGPPTAGSIESDDENFGGAVSSTVVENDEGGSPKKRKRRQRGKGKGRKEADLGGSVEGSRSTARVS